MSDSTPSDTTQSTASMIGGHANYVAGAVKETIGNLTGSEPWTTAGNKDKASAVDEMRAAKDAAGGPRDRNETVGKVEKGVGGLVGCEGMVEEGKKSTE